MTGAPGADAQRAAFEAEAARIRSLSPVAAFEEAGHLIESHTELRGMAARLRAEQARRIIDSGEATVAELAQQRGVTRESIYKLLRRAAAGR